MRSLSERCAVEYFANSRQVCWTSKSEFTRTQAAVTAKFSSWPASAALSRQRSLSTVRVQTSVATVLGKC